jgi:spore coat protein U-like protein
MRDSMIGSRWALTIFAAALLTVCSTSVASAADIFRFYAPPGGAYANAAFERSETVPVEITVEHEGVAIPSWFIAVSAGGAGAFEPREMSQGAETLLYQLYGTLPPSSDILKSPPTALTAGNVITTGDFGTVAATTERVSFTVYFSVPAAQFVPSGEYTDTVTLELYTGDFADPGTHTLVDTSSVSVTGRMAQIIDLYADREPGIRSLDLTTSVAGRLIATVFERSNSVTGYTVTITSANLASDVTGATGPYFAHTTASDTLSYSVSYDGAAIGVWSGGAAVVVDSAGTTAPEWISRELRISYTGAATLAAGDYEDQLVITISAK